MRTRWRQQASLKPSIQSSDAFFSLATKAIAEALVASIVDQNSNSESERERKNNTEAVILFIWAPDNWTGPAWELGPEPYLTTPRAMVTPRGPCVAAYDVALDVVFLVKYIQASGSSFPQSKESNFERERDGEATEQRAVQEGGLRHSSLSLQKQFSSSEVYFYYIFYSQFHIYLCLYD